MPQYTYFGRDAQLQAMSGQLEGSSPRHAAEQLAAMGIVPVKIES